jgi:hypothetical protein
MWSVHGKKKQVVSKCEDQMDQYFISSITSYGTRPTFDYKVICQCSKNQHCHWKLEPSLWLGINYGLRAIVPLLDFVHALIKLAQSCDVFVCNFIDAMKVCQFELYWLYSDPYIKFDDPIFDELKNPSPTRIYWWIGVWIWMVKNLIFLVSSFFVLNFLVINVVLQLVFIKLVLRLDFLFIMVPIKWSWEEYAKALMDELKGRFLNYELMLTLNLIYLNFWD